MFRGSWTWNVYLSPIRSEKLFALSTLYDANKEFLANKLGPAGSDPYEKTCEQVVQYWNTLAETMIDWKKVSSGLIAAAAVRQEKICTHRDCSSVRSVE